MGRNFYFGLMMSAGLVAGAPAMLAQFDSSTMPGSMPGNPASQSPQSQSPVKPTPNRQMQPSGMDQDSTGTSIDPQTMKDKIFLRKAVEGGTAEEELAKLVLSKSNNDELKHFAQMMLDDHSVLDGRMKPIAESLGVMTPKRMNKADQAEYEKLKALSGTEFDKEYLTAMIKDHRMDLHEFRQESATAADPALKDAATDGSKVIHDHLSAAYKLGMANGVEVPKMPKPTPES